MPVSSKKVIHILIALPNHQFHSFIVFEHSLEKREKGEQKITTDYLVG
jgi:hypothetical protein